MLHRLKPIAVGLLILVSGVIHAISNYGQR